MTPAFLSSLRPLIISRVLVSCFIGSAPPVSAKMTSVPSVPAHQVSLVAAAFPLGFPSRLAASLTVQLPLSLPLASEPRFDSRSVTCLRQPGYGGALPIVLVHRWKYGRPPSERTPLVVRQGPGAPTAWRLPPTPAGSCRSLPAGGALKEPTEA
jgi:hypothetical protein